MTGSKPVFPNLGRPDRRGFLQGLAAAAGWSTSRSPAWPLGRPQSQGRDLWGRLESVPASHPRLHLDSGGVAALRRKAAGTHRRYAQLLLGWIERHRHWEPPSGFPERSAEVALEEAAAFLTNAALAVLLEPEPQRLELARRWALAMARVPEGELRNYGLGIYAAGLARAYDWLFPYWSPPERRRLRAHLVFLLEQVYRGSLPGDEKAQWWADAHLHHDWWVPVGGLGEAALALLGEVPEASRWAAHARWEFDTAFSWLGEDGGWHEGAADWCYALAPLLWFYGAWQSVLGEDLHPRPWLRSTAGYRLLHWLPDDTYVYLNDSFRSGRYNTSGSASCHLLRRLASLFRDRHAQWLAGRDERVDLQEGPKGVYQAPYEGSSYQGRRREYPHGDSQCMAWNLLWYDPSVPPAEPRDRSHWGHFPDLGVAILHSGWEEDAAVVSLACGPLAGRRCARRLRAGESRSAANFGHAHCDYAALTLFARGHYFLVPPGYGRRASRFQNTLSVHGEDFPADPALDLQVETVSEGEGWLYAAAEASAAFSPHLQVEFFRRHLVLLPGCLVLYDELRRRLTSRAWSHWEWRLHSCPEEHRLELSGEQAVWIPRDGTEVRLILRVLEPREFAWERSLLQDREGGRLLEVLKIVRPEWYSQRLEVLVLLAWEELPEVVPLEAPGMRGVGWPEDSGRLAVAFAGTEEAVRQAHSRLPNTLLLNLSEQPVSPEVTPAR